MYLTYYNIHNALHAGKIISGDFFFHFNKKDAVIDFTMLIQNNVGRTLIVVLY